MFLCPIAAAPTFTGIAHSSCSNAGSTSLTGCPPTATGLITFSGANFYGGATITITPAGICSGALTVAGTFDSITCSLNSQSAGTSLSPIQINANGGSSANNGDSVTWCKQPFYECLYPV